MATDLPGHLHLGRTAYPGPATGGMVSIPFGSFNLTAGGTATDRIVAGLIMPVDFRIERVSWSAQAAATANVSFQLQKNTSFAVAGMTDILSADVDVDANENNWAAISGTTPTVVVRDLARGDYVFMTLTFDATGAISDAGPLTVNMIGFVKGVVAHDPAND